MLPGTVWVRLFLCLISLSLCPSGQNSTPDLVLFVSIIKGATKKFFCYRISICMYLTLTSVFKDNSHETVFPNIFAYPDPVGSKIVDPEQ